MDEQPAELREYLAEAEAVVSEWYSRDGVEGPHLANLQTVARLAAVCVVRHINMPFAVTEDQMLIYMVSAFQMGRASCDNDSSDSF